MPFNTDRLVDEINKRIKETVKKEGTRLLQGVVTSVEDTSDLYQVSVDGITHRYIRKISGVPVGVGSAVLMVKAPGVPMTIVGTPVGNVGFKTQAVGGLATPSAANSTSFVTCISVIDYGAVGDGAVNDTVAVQAAIDKAATGGGTVYFPAGTYLCDRLTWYPNVRLWGAGKNATIIRMNSPNDFLIRFLATPGVFTSGFTISDMTLFDGGLSGVTLLEVNGNDSGTRVGEVTVKDVNFIGGAVGYRGVYVAGTHIVSAVSVLTTDGFVINNCADTNLVDVSAVLGSGAGFYIVGGGGAFDEGLRLTNCISNGQAYGLYVEDQDWGIATGCSWTTCSSGAAVIDNVVNWSFVNCEFAAAVAVNGLEAVTSCSQVVVEGCKFALNSNGLVAKGDGWTVANNILWANTAEDIVLDDLSESTVTGNVCRSTGSSTSIDSSGTITDVTITGNVCAGTVDVTVAANHQSNNSPGHAAPSIISGNGTPEGNVTAPVGAVFIRLNGGAGSTLYVKESGSGDTGWAAK